MNDLRETSALEEMIRSQLIDRGVHDERVLEAMRAVPRDQFFGSDKEDAFADRAASIGHGQTISQPYIVGLMSERLELHGSERVLEIGTGSGYQTAILAKLAAEVYSIERIKPLLDAAFERVLSLGCRNVRFKLGDGTLGWPECAPFDRMLIAAAAPAVPKALLEQQLVEGGIAVLPIGAEQEQSLVAVRKVNGRLVVKDICQCRFVKLIGAEGWPGKDA